MDEATKLKLCAEALGWKHLGAVGVEPPESGDKPGLWCRSGGNDWWASPDGHNVCGQCSGIPDPLHDDSAAMALIKRFGLAVWGNGDRWTAEVQIWEDGMPYPIGRGETPNEAVTDCVANMQLTRTATT